MTITNFTSKFYSKNSPIFLLIILLIVSTKLFSQTSQVEYNFNDGQVPVSWIESVDSNSNWVVDSSVKQEGGFSLKSGDIDNSQNSRIEWQGLFDSGTIAFYYYLDTEGCCDKLRFSIDGIEVLNNGGVQNTWQEFRYNIAAGNHAFKWSYTKDGSVSTTLDSVLDR